MGMNYLVETRSDRLSGNRVNFLVQLAEGLDYLHKQGFLHRDICPRNAMVTNENVLKLIDFGLTIPNRPEFCKPGNRTGTPNYLAPELIRRVATDHRVDLFALGVTAYEVFTGGLPWPKAQGSMEVLLKHINQAARDPRDLKPDLPDDLHHFLTKAIEREPKLRFQSSAAFREALLRLGQSDVA